VQGTSYQEKCEKNGLKKTKIKKKGKLDIVKSLTERGEPQMFKTIETNDRAGTIQAAWGHGLGVKYAKADPRKYSITVQELWKGGTSSQTSSG
jgi:hypothetical protein